MHESFHIATVLLFFFLLPPTVVEGNGTLPDDFFFVSWGMLVATFLTISLAVNSEK